MSDKDKKIIEDSGKVGEIAGLVIVVAGLVIALAGFFMERDSQIIGHGVLLTGLGAGLFGGSEAIMSRALSR